ncbi:MAG: 30S ribosomal protein S17 [Parcubacteria group bacterium GW2011_GWB1_35_5]|uniref:Small ribosomal subunit protein uS17 n=1 Tax=Candidatus Zambryskibacteria bacterium RIFCSPLOWO2_01_FULL_35_19 TaxID=1802757 RepID=A0A1G2TVM4_9BACT|nr:MAG: 30S ribosomal protein S17 [Parcubacteria group bacterium GW2011_GWC1_34_10]KKP80471.1 MAG: 30S ribosomal protein S17 [Parcubacteria group bacterium GW2011_GWB1_35_5]OHA86778.1 MAG: 30S ribosomal protein S17 [Candidatus Zambryskibacteria bacterium RIFCSPHIGHO2_01_FULL_35_32]OHB01213.1 MAG: 30S ribosomal protein S17 [Candidatus Zambryskibacteria bacterium RIFCSPLOWO2_01_FULL_35_19]
MDKKEEKNNIETKKINKKVLSATVVSDKMQDTCIVLVSRFVKHKKYKKYHKVSKKYKVHDVGNTKKIGDKVTIMECRPLSKDKHFVIVN